ncbi:MAG: TIGR04076 family protein [Candidatus Heimdallarchaeota archaeon]
MARIKVTVERIDGYCNFPLLVGDYFFVDGSRLIIPKGKALCLWALQSMMPILPVLTQKIHLPASSWIKHVKHFSCPDPKGLVLFRLELEEKDASSAHSSVPKEK